MPTTPCADADALQVLIVDDSAVARALMSRMVATTPGFVVADAVGSVAAALQVLPSVRVDLIILDVEMPGVDGLTALPDLIASAGGARIVVVSSMCGEGATATIRALALGAADTVAKPGMGERTSRFEGELIEKLERLRGAALSRSRTAGTGVARMSIPRTQAYDLIAIGASTGGIHALSRLVCALTEDFTLPILITQHLPPSFMAYFAAQLSVLAKRPCDVATDRMRIQPGRIIIAAGDSHMRCVALGGRNAAIRLTHEPVSSGCMPSVDPMLESVAEVYGDRALAIVLSGMGRDGAEGARIIHDRGGSVIVQDEESSVVWGMPGAVAATGIAAATMPPDAIGQFVASHRRVPC
ncbi:chemotaxis protein CheB [Sphingomonas sp. Leaf17]|nr:chemotaxis protein CheB [Sphingomonas sp. Leaf17]